MKAFANIGDLGEDDQVALIAEATHDGRVVGFFVDDDAKADRYIEKLRPLGVRVVERKSGLVGRSIFVKVVEQAH